MDYKKLYPAQWEEFQKQCKKNKEDMHIKDPEFKNKLEEVEKIIQGLS